MLIKLPKEIYSEVEKLVEIKAIPKPYIAALGLDFGLNCGYAYSLFSESEKCWYIFPQAIGVANLNQSRFETGFTCFLRLIDLLNAINPKIIFYENIKYTPSFDTDVTTSKRIARVAAPSELLLSLRQTMLLWANDHNVATFPLEIKEIKKLATGSGKADKKMMIKKCNEKFGTSLDDSQLASNAADAAWILYSGLNKFDLP